MCRNMLSMIFLSLKWPVDNGTVLKKLSKIQTLVTFHLCYKKGTGKILHKTNILFYWFKGRTESKGISNFPENFSNNNFFLKRRKF